MDASYSMILGLGSTLFGAGVAWGTLRQMTSNDRKALRTVETRVSQILGAEVGTTKPLFTPLNDCVRTHEILTMEMEELRKSIEGLKNFARWFLTKEDMKPDQIEKIIGGD